MNIRLRTHQQVCPLGLQGPQRPETPGRTRWCRTSSPPPPQSWTVQCACWASSCSCCQQPAWHTSSNQCKIQPCLQHRRRLLMLAQTQLRLRWSQGAARLVSPLLNWWHAHSPWRCFCCPCLRHPCPQWQVWVCSEQLMPHHRPLAWQWSVGPHQSACLAPWPRPTGPQTEIR